jgi:hypothetical protein
LQNEVRNAINVTGWGRKLAVAPEHLKSAMRARGIDVGRIRLRAQPLPAATELRSDYKLWYDGELLFRLKDVPWSDRSIDSRWHVKRHPEADWWRQAKGLGRP